jgi:RimJ/RimL family protein N-acetyltransferase
MFPDLTRDDVFRVETRRLWLRWPRLQDAPAVARLAADKDIAEMTGVVPYPYPKGEAEKFIFEARKNNAMGTMLSFAIVSRTKPDQFIGRIGSRLLPDGPGGLLRCSLGYWLGRPHWGEGFATEAAHGLIDAVFSYTDMQQIEASTRVINPVSRRVIEKCGFQFMGSSMMELPALKGAVPVDTFCLPRSTWASLKGWREPRVEIDRSNTREPVRELAGCA